MNIIKQAICSAISSVNLGMARRPIITHKEHVVLYLMLKKSLELDIVSYDELVKLIQVRVLEIGKNNYEQHVKGSSLDYVTSLRSLAYALNKKIFTEKEAGKIQYDHEEDEAEFIQTYYIENFPKQILDCLLTKPKKPKPSKKVLWIIIVVVDTNTFNTSLPTGVFIIPNEERNVCAILRFLI